MKKRNEIIFSNMPDLVMAGKVSDKSAPGVWRSCTYEADGVEGVMFGCGEETRPEPVVLKLGVKGLYRVWLRLPVFQWGTSTQIRVRLTDDACCACLKAPGPDRWRAILHEIHWKDADLTGQDLIVEAVDAAGLKPGFLAGIRLEPIDRLPDKRTPEVEFPMAMTEDGHGVFWGAPHRRREDLLEKYEQIPDDTALKILLWGGAHGDHCVYPTQAGEYGFGPALEDYHRHQARTCHANLDLWKQNGWDALETARDYCRSRGWEIQFTVRVQAFSMSYPHDEDASRFFRDHPEYGCRDREGRAVARMSYAIPEVQERMLGIVRELSAYDPDGVGFIFIRGVPMILYEDAAVQGFRKQYGEDPRKLDEYDPRWMKYQGDVVNGFMRRARNVLKAGQKLIAVTPGNKFDCARWGLDVETWVREGLVNDLYPMGQRFTDNDVHDDSPCSLDVEYFQQLEGRAQIRLFPALYKWGMFGRDLTGWLNLVRSFKGRGADGYCVWDGLGYDFEKFSYLGTKGSGPAEKLPSSAIKISMLGDYRVDRYHPIEAH